jgi:HK97 family phage portal protein
VLPALAGAIRSLLGRSVERDTPTQLNLEEKTLGGFAFDAVSAAGWYSRNGYPGLAAALLGGMPAWSGETVSVEAALNHSVVWACIRKISSSVGFLPLNMLASSDGVTTMLAMDHPMYAAMHDAPNEEMTAYSFRETLTAHLLLQGNAYAQIFRRSGTGIANELHLLVPDQVTIDRDAQKRLVYVVKEGNEPARTFTVKPDVPHDILHLRGLGNDGIRGYSVITMARQSIGTAIATEHNTANFFRMGGRVPYVLKMAQKFRDDAEFDRFRAKWEEIYSTPHRAPILPIGMEYQQIGLNASDAQLLESRLFGIHEICRWFDMSPHMVGDLSRATFSNIEQLALEFVQFTLMAWLKRWEDELKRCVLTPAERKLYSFKHNVNGLLRGDFASRMTGYSTMLQNGIASINEVRELEDWDPVEGGDDHHIQLNMQTVPGGVPLTGQQSQLIRLGEQ